MKRKPNKPRTKLTKEEVEALEFDEKLIDDMIRDLDPMNVDFNDETLQIDFDKLIEDLGGDTMREDLKKMEKLLLSLSDETQREVHPKTYINTVTGDVGDDELNFWGNYEPENEDDINTVEEIYELCKKLYEEAQR